MSNFDDIPTSVKLLMIGMCVVFTALVTYTGYSLFDFYFGETYTVGHIASNDATESSETQQQVREAQVIMNTVSDNTQVIGEDGNSIDIDALLGPQQHINVVPTNTKAWLVVDGVDIHDPVMQGLDNDYYLSHNELGEEDKWGCYYFTANNEVTDIHNLDRKTLIFGHSNGNATHYKFSVLKKFKDQKFASANQYIHLTFGGLTTKWKIFAECDFPIQPSTFMDVNPTDIDFKDEITKIKELSYNKYDTTIQYGDKVLYLVTCTGNHQYDTRYIVCAKLVA